MAHTKREYTAEEIEQLNIHVRYEPLTGLLWWKVRLGGRQFHKALGCIDTYGYVKVKINGRTDYAHRIAWLLTYGNLPEFELDHVNQNPSDNRLENLRAVTTSQNQMNRGVPSNNTTGIKGVSVTPHGMYKVTKQGVHVGNYGTLLEAEIAYNRH